MVYKQPKNHFLGLKAILENFQSIETSDFSAKDANINIWVTFHISHILFYFLKWFSNGLWITFVGFLKWPWQISWGIEICTYDAKDTNINILVTLDLAQIFIYFS